MTMRPLAIALATTTMTAGVVIGVAGPASADVETRGTCTAGSAWEADIEREYGVYGIDFEVETSATMAPGSWNPGVSPGTVTIIGSIATQRWCRCGPGRV